MSLSSSLESLRSPGHGCNLPVTVLCDTIMDLENHHLDIDEVLSGKCEDTPEIAFNMVDDGMDVNTHQHLCLDICESSDDDEVRTDEEKS